MKGRLRRIELIASLFAHVLSQSRSIGMRLTSLLRLTQRGVYVCNFEEHFSPSLLCGDPQTILLDKVWPKIIMITALGMDTT